MTLKSNPRRVTSWKRGCYCARLVSADVDVKGHGRSLVLGHSPEILIALRRRARVAGEAADRPSQTSSIASIESIVKPVITVLIRCFKDSVSTSIGNDG